MSFAVVTITTSPLLPLFLYCPACSPLQGNHEIYILIQLLLILSLLPRFSTCATMNVIINLEYSVVSFCLYSHRYMLNNAHSHMQINRAFLHLYAQPQTPPRAASGDPPSTSSSSSPKPAGPDVVGLSTGLSAIRGRALNTLAISASCAKSCSRGVTSRRASGVAAGSVGARLAVVEEKVFVVSGSSGNWLTG